MPTDLQSILRIEVPVIVQIASRRMKVRDVSNLAPGAIIELPKLADEELDILVSNRSIGRGAAVKVGENFGLRVTRMGGLRERIEAMGEKSTPPQQAADLPHEQAADAATPHSDSVDADAAQVADQVRADE